MKLMTRARGELVYRRARRNPEHERYGCGNPQLRVATASEVLRYASIPHPEWKKLATAAPTVEYNEQHDALGTRQASSIYGGGEVLKELPGAGKVYDWRGTAWARPMIVDSHISPLIFVQHIPVIPQMEGIADFIRLRDVLVAQGLGVQFSTDRSGNVALFCDFDDMCYHARGANSFSIGCEHIHATTSEDWSEKQFRAAAWVINQAKNKQDIPLYPGELGSGNGVVRVLGKGQVSHERVSNAAGYYDRSDPGPGYAFMHVRELAMYWRENATFEGAPVL